MSQAENISVNSSTSSSKMLLAMVSIGTVCALLIAMTYEGTFDRIAYLQDEALKSAIFKVLPGSSTMETFALTEESRFEIAADPDKTASVVYAGYDEQGSFKGVAIEASGQGYAGEIRILYGYDPHAQKVVGFYVLQSNETPGLGDRIEKDSNFLANFNALDVSLSEEGALSNNILSVKNGTKLNPWEVDAITGATISSRAITDIIDFSTKEWVPLIYRARDSFDKKSSSVNDNIGTDG
ncbi:MAG: RnfABCDGE type electron transport complex subunit G [Flavobacteriales bacterium]|nr:RnfABCDGE type electron transport complex subunit G [Flavobacteriales bacterium]